MCEATDGGYSYFGYASSSYGSSSPADILSVEDACGAGVAVADLNSTEYLTLFSDTIVALNDDSLDALDGDVGPFAATIPAVDIESQCEVRFIQCRCEIRYATVLCVGCMRLLVSSGFVLFESCV